MHHHLFPYAPFAAGGCVVQDPPQRREVWACAICAEAKSLWEEHPSWVVALSVAAADARFVRETEAELKSLEADLEER